MIKFKKLNIVLFDFDATIALHSDHSHSSGLSESEFYSQLLTYGPAFFNNLQTNKHMRMFMDLCNKHGIRMGLISYASSNIIMQTRIQWVYQKYGYELENYCVGSREGKLDMLKAIQQTYWKGNKTVDPNDTGILYSPRQILIIDDVGQTLQEAADNNFSACTPMEVVNFIEDRQNTIGGNLIENGIYQEN